MKSLSECENARKTCERSKSGQFYLLLTEAHIQLDNGPQAHKIADDSRGCAPRSTAYNSALELSNGIGRLHITNGRIPMRNFATALAIVLVASTFTGYASQPTPEPKRDTVRTAETPETATPVNSCHQSGRTTMVQGDCPVDWDGQTVRVSGTCDVTPGTSSKGSCLRLQIKAESGSCTVSPGVSLPACGRLDATLLKNGDLHVQGGSACANAKISGENYNNSSVVCR